MITLKHAMASTLVAAGLTMPAAYADSPLTEAFADYLGYCWSSPLGQSSVEEIYCFERLENDFVRRLHSVEGPHGMHWGEEVLHWDSENSSIVSRYYNNRNAFSDGGGTIVDGRPVLFSYSDWDGAVQLRMHWGEVTGDEAIFIREQYHGEDYGGWNTEEPRTFTRMGPVSEFEEDPGTYTLRGPTVEAFDPLLFKCWWATFDETDRTDTHCFTPVLGVQVRSRHIVPGNPDYSGETLFHMGAEGQVHFRYFNSIGGVSDGTARREGNDLIFGEETYTGDDGETRTFRGRYLGISEDGYQSVTEERVDGEWVVVSDMHFTRSPFDPFAPIVDAPVMPTQPYQ